MAGVRGTLKGPIDASHRPFGFLTTEPNVEAAAVNYKAMPVIFTSSEEIELSMTAPIMRPYRCDARRRTER